MFKNFLFALDKPAQDGISERIDREPIVAKYWFNLGASIIFMLLTIGFGTFSILKYSNPDSPVTYAVNLKAKTQQTLNVLPYPHQSMRNVQAWIIDAVTAVYSLDFAKYDEEVDRASYFFTEDGYRTYQNALLATKTRAAVVGKKLQISVIPMHDPIYINGGTFGTTEFWRFKMPVLVSFYGGKEPVTQKTMIELLVLRVPSYQNYKGLAIAEFNMLPI